MKAGPAGIPVWMLIGLAGALATAPASVASWLLVATPFHLIASHGSLWSGGGWLCARGDGNAVSPLMPLSWSLSWQAGPVVQLRTSEGTGTVRMGITQLRLLMPPFRIDLPMLPFPSPLAEVSPAGALRGISGQFDLDYGSDWRGSARLRVENLNLGAFPADRLGALDITAHADDRGLSMHLVADGRAMLSGELTLRRQGRQIFAVGDMRAKHGASDGLSHALAALNRAGGGGQKD